MEIIKNSGNFKGNKLLIIKNILINHQKRDT